MTETSLAVVQNSPASLISAALSSGADLDKLKGLMELQIQWESNEAKKAFVQAMADFKANPPEIEKDKNVAYGTTKYSHASLANVTSKINSGLAKYGLSASWTTKQNGLEITVTCTITHSMGHSESTSLTAEADNSGQKNKIQAIGSCLSYLERYSILALTGLATHDQDDDGVKSEIKTITDEQCLELEAMVTDNQLNANGKWLGEFLAYLKVESFDQMPAKDFNKAKAALQGIISKRVKK